MEDGLIFMRLIHLSNGEFDRNIFFLCDHGCMSHGQDGQTIPIGFEEFDSPRMSQKYHFLRSGELNTSLQWIACKLMYIKIRYSLKTIDP